MVSALDSQGGEAPEGQHHDGAGTSFSPSTPAPVDFPLSPVTVTGDTQCPLPSLPDLDINCPRVREDFLLSSQGDFAPRPREERTKDALAGCS